MSSGEAELYALVKGAVQTKYAISLAMDFGIELDGHVRTDSNAAIGITHRSGLGGRTRHVQVQYLWVQGAVSRGEIKVEKVRGEDNLSDILTKCVPAEVLNRHLRAMNFIFLGDATNDDSQLSPAKAVSSEGGCKDPYIMYR